jgi:hypothetical protein
MEKNEVPNSITTEQPIPPRFHCWGCPYLKLKLDSEKFSIGHVPVCLKKNQQVRVNVFNYIPSWCPTDGEFKDERLED